MVPLRRFVHRAHRASPLPEKKRKVAYMCARTRTVRSTTLIILILIAFLVGAFVSHYRSQHALAICKDQNLGLARDLGSAVKRGVILETNLNLCQENK